MDSRRATHADLDELTATLTAAFRADPLWSWAFPNPEDLAVWWRFYITSALRYPCVWVMNDCAAVSIWIPPGGTELTEEEEERVEPLLVQLVGPRAPDVVQVLERFEASHPPKPPHYYLSLLGTHPDHRGRGLGMSLLAERLASIDTEGMPAYLESTNPDNNRRYERLRFRRIGEFTTPDGRRTVTTMWRDTAGGPTEQAMSENAAVIERAYAAWDRAGLDAFLEHWAADARWHAMEGAPDDSGPMEDRDAIRAYLQDWIDIFAEFKVEPVELIDAGEEQVVAVLRISGIVRHGGVKVPASYLAALFVIRDGRIIAGGEFENQERALEAARL